MPVQTAIQVRRGTAASWTSTNPTLAAGEIGFETDTNRFKIGTGSAAWASLNYFAQDPVTTKGDLYTFSTTDTRLAVGNNGETLVADSSTSTGLRWQTGVNQNLVINGAAEFWQRGTSFTSTGYTADRWYFTSPGSNTISRSTDCPSGFNYSINWAAAGSYPGLWHYVELPVTGAKGPFTGTWTLSFYAKASTNTSISTSIQWMNGSARSNGVLINDTLTALTTSWQRFSVTVNLDSTSPNGSSTAIEIGWYIASVTGTPTINITGVQFERGSVATTYKRAGNTLAGELAACQRYYQRFPKGSSTNGGPAAIGYAVNTGTVLFQLPTLVEMRTTPTAIDSSGMRVTDSSNTNVDGATFTLEQASPTNLSFYALKTASFTATRLCILTRASNANDYIGFSAEL